MNGPTWAQVATQARKIERRDVKINDKVYACPFCSLRGWASLLTKSTGHRCNCGALFYAQQAVAVHFRERDTDGNS